MLKGFDYTGLQVWMKPQLACREQQGLGVLPAATGLSLVSNVVTVAIVLQTSQDHGGSPQALQVGGT